MGAPLQTATGGHVPVMLPEVLAVLRPHDGGIYLDGTFGRGGYARAILEAADCRLVALDRDPAAIAAGRALEREFAGRLRLVEGRFGEMDDLAGEPAVDGVALDLGVSSPQLDEADRGFSFRSDGPLDMRMGGEGPSATAPSPGPSSPRGARRRSSARCSWRRSYGAWSGPRPTASTRPPAASRRCAST